MKLKNTLSIQLAVALLAAAGNLATHAQTNRIAEALPAVTNVTVAQTKTISPPASPVPPPGPLDKGNYRGPHEDNNFTDNLALMIPMMGMAVGFAIPVTIIAILAIATHRRNKMANETLRLMIEKGQTITPELVNSLKAKQPGENSGTTVQRSRKDLRNGLLLAGIGIGIVMLCGKPGWIVVFIGVAFIVAGALKLGGDDNKD